MTPPCYQILPVRALQTTFGDPQRLQMILRLGGCGVLPDLGLFPAEHLQDDVPGSALAHHVRHGPSGERALTPSYGSGLRWGTACPFVTSGWMLPPGSSLSVYQMRWSPWWSPWGPQSPHSGDCVHPGSWSELVVDGHYRFGCAGCREVALSDLLL